MIYMIEREKKRLATVFSFYSVNSVQKKKNSAEGHSQTLI